MNRSFLITIIANQACLTSTNPPHSALTNTKVILLHTNNNSSLRDRTDHHGTISFDITGKFSWLPLLNTDD